MQRRIARAVARCARLAHAQGARLSRAHSVLRARPRCDVHRVAWHLLAGGFAARHVVHHGAVCVCAYANYESTCAIGSTRCNQVRLNELVYIGTIARFGVSQRGLRCVGMFSVCATFACSSTRRVDCRIVAQALAPRFRCPLSCGSTFRFGYMS